MFKKAVSLTVLLLLMLPLIFSSCASGKQETPQPKPKEEGPPPKEYDHSGNCADWAEFRVSDFIVQNNTYGKANIKEYKQCIYHANNDSLFPFGWTWDWPRGIPSIKGFPCIIYGFQAWRTNSTTPNLPRLLSEIKELTASYAISMKTDGACELGFKIWMNKTIPPKPDNISHLLHIWLDNQRIPSNGKFIEMVVIDGEEYAFYLGSNVYVLFEFIKKTPEYTGDTKIKLFFDHLLGKNYLDKTVYCGDVDFGNEIAGATGQTEISSYSITVK